MPPVAPSEYPPPFDSESVIAAPTDPEDERIEVGVAIVGGGPAGLAAAVKTLQLLEDKPELMEKLGEVPVAVVEKGKVCGAHAMSGANMRPSAMEDVLFGWQIARRSADLDIGQALAVKDGDIIAVEAMEGTDRMIQRAGRLCRSGGWTLIKVARPNQDMRFDVPTIGPDTFRRLKDCGGTCVVVEAGRTIIIDKPQTLALADELRIPVVGKKP